MYQDKKDDMMKRWRFQQWYQNYKDNQEKAKNPVQSTINGLGNAYKAASGFNKGMEAINKLKQPQLSAIGEAANSSMPINNLGSSIMDNSSIMNANTSNLLGSSANTGAISNAINAETGMVNNAAQSATQGATQAGSTVGNAVSSAAPIAGAALGGFSAANNFKNGDYTNGALDLAKTGAMFIPGVGWAVSGAIQLGQMIKNMFDKKRQEAMAKSKAMADKTQQETMQDFSERQQGFDEMQQENAQKMQNQLQSTGQDNNAIIQEIMNRVQNGQQELPNNIQPYEQIDNGINTGGASQVFDTNTPEVLTGHVEQDQPQGVLGQLPELTQQEGTPEANKQSIMSKLGSFASDFSRGYDDNLTNGFTQGDLYNQIQQTQSTKQRNDLANSLGQFGQGNIDLFSRPQVKNDDGTISTVRSMSFNDGTNEVLIPTVSDDGKILSDEEAIKNYNDTGKYLGKFDSADEANAYADKLHNQQDAYYNKGVSTGGAATPVQPQKSIGQRLGEAVGTGARIMANPWTQAAIAGGISRMSGGGWDDAALAAYKYGTNKAMSDYYQKQIDPNAKPNVIGNYTATDYNAKTLNDYRGTLNNINNAKILAQLDQNFPLAKDYYASQLASGQISLDDYNKAVSDINYNPNQRISLKTIKTTSDSNYQKDKIGIENKKADNSYNLGKEKNQISWANAGTYANRVGETKRHNEVMEGQGQQQIDAKVKAAQAKAAAKKKQEIDNAIITGEKFKMLCPDGKIRVVDRADVREAQRQGCKVVK